MKKLIIAIVILGAAGMSSCKKEEMAQPSSVKVKAIGDIREHTGWDREDSTTTHP